MKNPIINKNELYNSYSYNNKNKVRTETSNKLKNDLIQYMMKNFVKNCL